MVSATCPDCKIVLVEASSNSTTDLLPAVDEAVALGANAVTMSWGAAEWAGETSGDSHFNHPGVAFLAASGDTGYGTTLWPAASPSVFAVGGTALAQDSSGRFFETAWSGATSGCSPYEPKPAYQTDTGCARRTIADVSADGGSSLSLYSTYPANGWVNGWQGAGGTSASSPLVAGMWMLTSGAQDMTAGPSSWYRLPAGPFSINDIASGSTGSCGTYLCNALPGYDGPTGVGTPHGPQAIPTPKPVATTSQASGVSQSGATLNGTVNPNGSAVTLCQFDYSASTTYYPLGNYDGAMPCTQAPGSGTAGVPVSAQLAGLPANQSYHFRVVAVNAGGTRFGADQTFTTGPVQPPTVTSDLASGVSQTGATLNGTINPNGLLVTDCQFNYDTGPSYGLSVPCGPLPGAGTSAVAVSAQVSGLVPGQTYHFRLTATTSAGSAAGADQTFTPAPLTPSPATYYGGRNPGLGGSQCNQPATGDPITCSTGNLFETVTDLAVAGPGRAVAFQRTYNAQDAATASAPGGLGWGWTDSYAMSLTTDASSGYITVHQENGAIVPFVPTPSGYVAPAWVTATLAKNADGTFTYTLADQRSDTFSAGGQLLSESDRNGYQTTLTYANSRLDTVTDAAGRSLQFAYNGAGQLASATDPRAGKALYAYDAAGNLTSVTDPAGGVTRYGYDSNHRLVLMTDALGNQTTNVYDNANRVTSQTDPSGGTRTLSYAPGHTTTITDANGDVTVETFNPDYLLLARTVARGTPAEASWSYTYDSRTDEPTTVTDPNGKTSSYVFDARGNAISTTDTLGRTTTATYDAQNNPLTSVDATGATTSYSYDSHGNLIDLARPLAGTSQVAHTQRAYDANRPGDLTSITDPSGVKQTFSYDQYGNLSAKTDGAGDKTTYAYDQDGNLTSQVSPRGNTAAGIPTDYTTTIQRDALGRPTKTTDPNGHATVIAYDADGNKISVTDPDQHQTQYAYDKLNHLTGTLRPDGSQPSNGYDANGNRITSTDALGNITRYAYNARDELVKQTDPLGRATSYAYDQLGDRTSVTAANGKTTRYTYDAAKQPTAISYNDPSTPDVTYSYDADGRRVAMTDGTGATSYTYDSLGRLTQHAAPGSLTLDYTYDLAGRVTQLSYPSRLPSSSSGVSLGVSIGSAKSISRSYDAAGRLSAITDFNLATINYTYDANGNILVATYPNKTSETRSYDHAGQLTRIIATGPNGTILDLPYQRDPNGQITTDTATALSTSVPETYSYNQLNQLTSATIPSPTTVTATRQQYAYDQGDRITTLAQLGVPVTLSYDTANQPTKATNPTTTATIATYTYDQSGNRTQATNTATGAQASYTYDQANRLTRYRGPTGGLAASALTSLGQPNSAVSLTDTSYTYNGDGLRADLLWDEAQNLPTVLADPTHTYITGPDGLPVEQTNIAGQTHYYLHDHLSSTRALTDQNGTTLALNDYDPYGNTNHTTGTTTDNPFGYAGQYTDANTGLQYLRARWYDPTTAQFLTRDPLESVTGEPYTYAGDNPISFTDPAGLLSLGDVGDYLNTKAQLPNSRLFTGVINGLFGGYKLGKGIVLLTAGAAADVTGVGAILGLSVQAYGIFQVTTGVDRIVRGFQQFTEALSTATVCKTPLQYGEDLGLDLAPGGGAVEHLLGGLP